MAEKEEKGNFLTIVAIGAIASIALVLMLKGRETEHLKYSSTSVAENAAALQGVVRHDNNFE